MLSFRGIPALAVTLSLLLSSVQIAAPAPPAVRFERPYPPAPGAIPAAAQLYQEQRAAPQSPGTPEAITGIESYTRLVYQAVGITNNEYNWEIARVPYLSDHHTPENVSNHPAYDITPRLSPDGEWIAFCSDRDGRYEIYTMKWDGSQQTRLTFTEREEKNLSPVWSPDGSEIAFYTNRDGNNEIYVMNADGSAQTRLTYDDASDFSPAWSPDGQKIAWIRVVSSFEGVIIIADADGSDAAAISPPLAYLDNLAWHPGSDKLAFTYEGSGDAWFDIGSILADGTRLRRRYYGSEYKDLWMASWLADDTLLVSEVTYDVEFNITGTFLHRGWYFGGDWIESYSNFQDSFSPHAQRIDNTAPLSAVDELPAYSRASGFLVSWSGSDVGPAGIESFQKQIRQGSIEWVNWWTNLPVYLRSGEYFGVPGEHVYFRSAATDYAGNVEAWPEGDGDTDTTLYLWELAGQIGDNRNYPVPLAALSLSPPAANSLQSDPDGAYTAYLIEGGEHNLQAEAEGYGALPGMNLDVNSDERLSASLPPNANLVSNGGFENSPDPFAGWTITGTLPFTSTRGHSGERALRLGEFCAPPCLSAPEQPYEAHVHSAPNLDYGPDGTLYVVWNRTDFASRAPNGQWSFEIIPGNFGTIGSSDSYESQIQVDPMGNLHVIVMGDTNAYYVQKPAGGDWLPPYELEDAWNLEFTVDSTGKVHIAYWCYYNCAYASGTYYLYRTPAGVWREPLSLGYDGTPPLLGVGPDGTVHLMYHPTGSSLLYRQILPDGTLTGSEYFDAEDPYALTVDAGGGVHALIYDPRRAQSYVARSTTGEWTEPLNLPGPYAYSLEMRVDTRGGVHIATMDGGNNVYYYRKPAGSRYFELFQASSDYSYPGGHAGIAVTPDGRVAMTWSDINSLLNVVSTRIAAQTSASTASQALAIPAGLHAPTLSFLCRFEGFAGWEQSRYQAWLQAEDGTVTSLISSTQQAPWELVWADASQWAGQTVTLTVEVQQQLGEPVVQLALDEVALGAWETPVITGVSPAQVDPGIGATFTITGSNYIDPVVRLGGTEIPATVVDEHTLSVLLLAGVQPRVYDVWVVNAGGQAAVLPRGLQVGRWIFLPRLQR